MEHVRVKAGLLLAGHWLELLRGHGLPLCELLLLELLLRYDKAGLVQVLRRLNKHLLRVLLGLQHGGGVIDRAGLLQLPSVLVSEVHTRKKETKIMAGLLCVQK